jgi:hypothetical protein
MVNLFLQLALHSIITDIERYRSLLTVMKENGDLNFLQ